MRTALSDRSRMCVRVLRQRAQLSRPTAKQYATRWGVARASRSRSKSCIGEVEFHLHPTFDPAIRRVPSEGGAAQLRVDAWGAFTVGAVVLDTLTQLELDLSTLSDAPKTFRER